MTLILWLLFGVGLPVVLLTYIYYMRGKSDIGAAYEDDEERVGLGEDGKYSIWVNRPGVSADLIWVIVYTAISATIYAIIVMKAYPAHDLSYFVWPPLVVALQIGIGARIARIFMPMPWHKYVFYLLNGVAVAYFAFIMLGRVAHIDNTLTYYFYGGIAGGASRMTAVLSKIASNRVYFILGIGAITVYKAAPFLHEIGGRLRRWRELVLAISMGLASWGIYAVFASFSSEWGPIIGIGWVIFIGMVAMAVGTLAYYGRSVQDALISEVCLWLSSSKMRPFVIGIIVASYVIFLRPFIYNRVAWATALIEWATFCFVVWRMYDGIRGRISDAYSVELKYTSWKRHTQLVEKQVDGDYSYTRNVQADFVERSHKDQLLVYLVALMHDNGVSVEEISEVLHALSEYSDESIPVFSFTKKRTYIRKNNRENRERILKDIMAALRERDVQVA